MTTLRALLASRLSPFRSEHFRSLYFAQGLSLIGSWMQELARSWIVITLSGRATSIGTLLFAAAVPNILLGSLGGSIADQRGAKGTLLVTQVALATSAFALGVLVSTGSIEFWHLLIFAVLEGCVIAFDVPAFNLVTPRLVPREHFQQALALNAVNFHLSRVLGPSLAGLIMGFAGAQSVFYINAVSFMGVVFVISRLPIDENRPAKSGAPRARMREVLRHLIAHPVFFRILLQFVLLMAMVFPLIFTTLRIFIQERFSLGARDFGLVFAAPGAGALIGSLGFLMWSPKAPMRVLPYGIAGTVIFLIAIAEAMTLPMAVVMLVLFSISIFLLLSSLLVTLQLKIEDHMRGRLSALVGMGFVAISPLMAVPIGALTDWLGARVLLWGIALSFGLLSLLLPAIARRRGTPSDSGVTQTPAP